MASHWRILNKGMVGTALHFNKITLVVLLGKLKGDTGWKQGLSVRRLQQSSRENSGGLDQRGSYGSDNKWYNSR